VILAQQTTLQFRYSTCIWCNRRFLPNGFKQDRTVNFGPVERSEEHIIPANIYGGVITLDLCKCCNERFGNRADYHLLRDERVFTAAIKAGVKSQDFLKRFSGSQESTDGLKKVEVTFQNGNYRITPGLNNLNRLSIGSVDGEIRECDLLNLKNRLTQKVRKKFKVSSLSPDQNNRVAQLVDSVAKSPAQVHYDEVLGEGFRPSALSPSIKAQIKSHPWITDWCIAKILFETTTALMPTPYPSFLKPVLEHFRKFVEAGLAAELGDCGKSIFKSGNDEQSASQHTILITATRTSYDSEVRLFGSAWWRFSCSLTPNKLPPQRGFRVEVVNPFGTQAEITSFKVTDL
jgi:hypothetical protein